jgi:hypothetical protein
LRRCEGRKNLVRFHGDTLLANLLIVKYSKSKLHSRGSTRLAASARIDL